MESLLLQLGNRFKPLSALTDVDVLPETVTITNDTAMDCAFKYFYYGRRRHTMVRLKVDIKMCLLANIDVDECET